MANQDYVDTVVSEEEAKIAALKKRVAILEQKKESTDGGATGEELKQEATKAKSAIEAAATDAQWKAKAAADNAKSAIETAVTDAQWKAKAAADNAKSAIETAVTDAQWKAKAAGEELKQEATKAKSDIEAAVTDAQGKAKAAADNAKSDIETAATNAKADVQQANSEKLQSLVTTALDQFNKQNNGTLFGIDTSSIASARDIKSGLIGAVAGAAAVGTYALANMVGVRARGTPPAILEASPSGSAEPLVSGTSPSSGSAELLVGGTSPSSGSAEPLVGGDSPSSGSAAASPFSASVGVEDDNVVCEPSSSVVFNPSIVSEGGGGAGSGSVAVPAPKSVPTVSPPVRANIRSTSRAASVASDATALRDSFSRRAGLRTSLHVYRDGASKILSGSLASNIATTTIKPGAALPMTALSSSAEPVLESGATNIATDLETVLADVAEEVV